MESIRVKFFGFSLEIFCFLDEILRVAAFKPSPYETNSHGPIALSESGGYFLRSRGRGDDEKGTMKSSNNSLKIGQEFGAHFSNQLRRPLLLLVVLILSAFGAAVLVWAKGKISPLVQRAATETLFLASEMRDEAGPFAEARKRHIGILRTFISRMETREKSRLVPMLLPQFSARKHLGPVLARLEAADTSEADSKNAIEKSAVMLEAQGRKWAMYSHATNVCSSKRSPLIETMIRDQIETFDQTASAFYAAKNNQMEAAILACTDSRLLASEILGQWPEFTGCVPDNQLIDSVSKRFGQLRDRMRSLAKSHDLSSAEAERLSRYADNIHRRIGLLEQLNCEGKGYSAINEILLSPKVVR